MYVLPCSIWVVIVPVLSALLYPPEIGNYSFVFLSSLPTIITHLLINTVLFFVIKYLSHNEKIRSSAAEISGDLPKPGRKMTPAFIILIIAVSLYFLTTISFFARTLLRMDFFLYASSQGDYVNRYSIFTSIFANISMLLSFIPLFPITWHAGVAYYTKYKG